MGQRGFVSTICRSTENGVHMPPADGAGARPVSVTLPAELPGIAPVPLGHADVEISKCSWLTVTESALAREWHAARVKQSKGVSSTSPHVPLTCASVVFPQNRSSGIIYSDPGRDLEKTGIPVGQEYFRALQSAWRNEGIYANDGKDKGQCTRSVRPPVDISCLDESDIEEAIEDAVGTLLQPPVPLSFMVSNVLVPQWELGGLYDAPALRQR
uniref:Uncharacterized protein n=1 Tax=Trypanosoma vivax (strain Y486) TaxID=1055687 RepID=G0U1T8_TRYVY|nr:conserved hypothetical protein [Trypanosoma vivax Y486]